MKHIEVMQNSRNPELPKILANVSSNSFGDQIIEYRSLDHRKTGSKREGTFKRVTQYVTIAVVTRHEGDWLTSDQAIRTYYHSVVKLKRTKYPSEVYKGAVPVVTL